MPRPSPADDASPARHCDLTVYGARESWQRIRWALFVFPDITDVAPTDDADVVRVFYEGTRPYPCVWTVELRQRGFDLPTKDTCGRDGHRPRAVLHGRAGGELLVERVAARDRRHTVGQFARS
jgi:hypothetical protein